MIILVDTSDSASNPYKPKGMPIIEAEKKILKERIENTFDNNLNVGVYSFSGGYIGKTWVMNDFEVVK